MRVLQLGPYPPPHGGVQSNLVAIRPGLYQELAKKRGKGGEIIDKRLGAPGFELISRINPASRKAVPAVSSL